MYISNVVKNLRYALRAVISYWLLSYQEMQQNLSLQLKLENGEF